MNKTKTYELTYPMILYSEMYEENSIIYQVINKSSGENEMVDLK